MSDLGIDWDQLRRGTVAELREGTTFVTLVAFCTYWAAEDGTVRGHGYEPPRGTAWTVRSISGGKLTAVSHNGREVSEALPTDQNRRILIKR